MTDDVEQIHAKLCAYIDGELTGADREEIERIVQSDPVHMALMRDLLRQRDLLHSLPRESAPADLMENLQAQLEREALLGTEDDSRLRIFRASRWPQILSAAAVFILAAGLGIVVYSVLPGKRPAITMAPPEDRSAAPAPADRVAETPELPSPLAARGMLRPEEKATPREVEGLTTGIRGAEVAKSEVAAAPARARAAASPRMLAMPARRSAPMRKGGEANVGIEINPDSGVITVTADNTQNAEAHVLRYLADNQIAWSKAAEDDKQAMLDRVQVLRDQDQTLQFGMRDANIAAIRQTARASAKEPVDGAVQGDAKIDGQIAAPQAPAPAQAAAGAMAPARPQPAIRPDSDLGLKGLALAERSTSNAPAPATRPAAIAGERFARGGYGGGYGGGLGGYGGPAIARTPQLGSGGRGGRGMGGGFVPDQQVGLQQQFQQPDLNTSYVILARMNNQQASDLAHSLAQLDSAEIEMMQKHSFGASADQPTTSFAASILTRAIPPLELLKRKDTAALGQASVAQPPSEQSAQPNAIVERSRQDRLLAAAPTTHPAAPAASAPMVAMKAATGQPSALDERLKEATTRPASEPAAEQWIILVQSRPAQAVPNAAAADVSHPSTMPAAARQSLDQTK